MRPVTLEQLAAAWRTAMAAHEYVNCPFCDVELVRFLDGGIGATTEERIPHPGDGCIWALLETLGREGA